jgi:hypothetical protein
VGWALGLGLEGMQGFSKKNLGSGVGQIKSDKKLLPGEKKTEVGKGDLHQRITTCAPLSSSEESPSHTKVFVNLVRKAISLCARRTCSRHATIVDLQ